MESPDKDKASHKAMQAFSSLGRKRGRSKPKYAVGRFRRNGKGIKKKNGQPIMVTRSLYVDDKR